jgi:hypothetical protein
MQDFTRYTAEELRDIVAEWPLTDEELAAVKTALADLGDDPGYGAFTSDRDDNEDREVSGGAEFNRQMADQDERTDG